LGLGDYVFPGYTGGFTVAEVSPTHTNAVLRRHGYFPAQGDATRVALAASRKGGGDRAILSAAAELGIRRREQADRTAMPTSRGWSPPCDGGSGHGADGAEEIRDFVAAAVAEAGGGDVVARISGDGPHTRVLLMTGCGRPLDGRIFGGADGLSREDVRLIVASAVPVTDAADGPEGDGPEAAVLEATAPAPKPQGFRPRIIQGGKGVISVADSDQ
jgi:hypothetical protein